MKVCINNIIPFSAVDGIGNRMIVFFQGCNFNCLYCHNPETIPFASVESYEEGFVMTPENIVEKVKGQMPFIRGVTLSGGECTASYEALLETVKALKTADIHVLVDTNGFIDQDKLETLADYVDGFMLDIKAIIPDEHKKLTGVSNELVLASFETLCRLNKLEEVRTVVLGNLVDSRETVEQVSRLIADCNAQIPYKLIRFRKHGIPEAGKELVMPSDNLMDELRELALHNGVVTVMTL
jgi:pyruvate-formate lyase-activating enzyme